jgi:putative chitobiose transport system permease protein
MLLILLALLVLTPLLWLVSTSLKGPAEDIFVSPPALLPANQASMPTYGCFKTTRSRRI